MVYCCLCSDLDIVIYPPEGDPPAPWWDEECDKSLLVGVYKYGGYHANEFDFETTTWLYGDG